MLAYRICRAAFTALDGEGARLYGGRWTRVGRPALYTSSSLSLAALEYLIHVDPADAPSDLVALTIEIPDALAITRIDIAKLPKRWAEEVSPSVCQNLGDKWLLAGATPVLRVPAAPVPEEFNYLVNPRHTDARRVRTRSQRSFAFDPRLVE